MKKEKLENMIKLTADFNKKITTVKKENFFSIVILPESHDINEYIEVPYKTNSEGKYEEDINQENNSKPLTQEQQLEINEIKKIMFNLQKRLNDLNA